MGDSLTVDFCGHSDDLVHFITNFGFHEELNYGPMKWSTIAGVLYDTDSEHPVDVGKVEFRYTGIWEFRFSFSKKVFGELMAGSDDIPLISFCTVPGPQAVTELDPPSYSMVGFLEILGNDLFPLENFSVLIGGGRMNYLVNSEGLIT